VPLFSTRLSQFSIHTRNRRKSYIRFLGALPFIGIAVTFAGIAIVWKVVTAGFLLSTFIMIITLNIIVIEEAPEVYINSKLFIKAVQNKSNFAEGDVKALNLVRKLASKISNYYPWDLCNSYCNISGIALCLGITSKPVQLACRLSSKPERPQWNAGFSSSCLSTRPQFCDNSTSCFQIEKQDFQVRKQVSPSKNQSTFSRGSCQHQMAKQPTAVIKYWLPKKSPLA